MMVTVTSHQWNMVYEEAHLSNNIVVTKRKTITLIHPESFFITETTVMLKVHKITPLSKLSPDRKNLA